MIEITWDTLPLILIAAAVAVLGTARFTRMLVHDNFPPARWWREHWVRWTLDTGWDELFTCWWCMAFWVALACIGWFIAGLFVLWAAWAWWIFWGALAIGYVAPMIIVRDGEPED